MAGNTGGTVLQMGGRVKGGESDERKGKELKSGEKFAGCSETRLQTGVTGIFRKIFFKMMKGPENG